ncbi:MAG: VWA domain-containing protein [Acidobacteria bacterium]|nr:VWA domain-containing protein [Acidobacteriota bacterium]
MKSAGIPIAALLLAALPAASQETPAPDLFSEVIDVRVVNVEAVVTDKEGNRIPGLPASDFELWVDGWRVPIEYFSEIDDGVARSTSETDAASDSGDSGKAPETPEAVHAVPPDEHVRTNYLVYIDEFFAVRKNRDRVLKRLEKDLSELHPEDHVAVVAFDGRNVARLTDWTNRGGQVRDALREARKRKALGLMRRADRDPVAMPAAGADQAAEALSQAGLGDQPELLDVQRSSTSLLQSKRERQIHRSVLAAATTLRSFADPPGRKVMLILTDGWGVPSWGNTNPMGPPPPSLEDIYGPLAHTANRIGYTLYPVDLPGLNPAFRNSPFGIGDASVGYNEGSFADPTVTTMPSPFSMPAGLNVEWFQEAALAYLAHETGGVPMINSFRDNALAGAAADTRSYYWLGFEPRTNQTDELHEIEVRVIGHPDLRVRSRRSYFDLSKTAQVTMMTEGAVLFGGAPGKETLGVRIGVPEPTRGRRIHVPMEIAIPLDDIEVLPMGGRFMNELEFRVTLINEGGERSETPVQKVQISGATEPPPGAVFVFETTLLLRSNEHRFVASVYDPLTGAVLSAQGTVGPRSGREASEGG